MATQKDKVAIPFLPGNTFSDPRKTDFRRAQTLGFKCGIPVQAAEPPAIGQTMHLATSMRKPLEEEYPELDFTMTYGTHGGRTGTMGSSSASATLAAADAAAAAAAEKKILTFSAYFKEVENPVTGEERVRFVRLVYYVEDGTLTVWEPRVANSGLTHGTLVKRQRVPVPADSGSSGYYGEDQLQVGADVVLYAVPYHIYDCDIFTREYFRALGREQLPAEDPPQDSYKERRKAVEKPERQAAAANPEKLALRRFLENDRRVLRFYCLWDNTHELFGERLHFILCYYLVDDTADIREVRSPNDGRDIFTLFLRRQRIPKPGSGYVAADARTPAAFYTDVELGIGVTINVLGRDFLLYDADRFTRDYYASKYGISEWPQVDVARSEAAAAAAAAEADAAQKTLARSQPLVPRPPRQDVRKMLENHGRILRFRAVVEAPAPAREEEFRGRQFVIAFWLADDTISVVEIPNKNGIPGGRFVERRRVHRPASPQQQRRGASPRSATATASAAASLATGISEEEGEWYQASDLYLGARLDLDGWRFVLVDAAEYALQYMESRPGEFPLSDLDWVLDHLSRLLAPKGGAAAVEASLKARDQDGSGRVTAQQFRDSLPASGLVEQELVTLTRRFDVAGDGSFAYDEFLSLLKSYEGAPAH